MGTELRGDRSKFNIIRDRHISITALSLSQSKVGWTILEFQKSPERSRKVDEMATKPKPVQT